MCILTEAVTMSKLFREKGEKCSQDQVKRNSRGNNYMRKHECTLLLKGTIKMSVFKHNHNVIITTSIHCYFMLHGQSGELGRSGEGWFQEG